jgi:hypothetical protein
MKDLLDDWETVPKLVKECITQLDIRLIDGDNIFETIEFYKSKVEKLGYTFEYDKYGEIFNLKKI